MPNLTIALKEEIRRLARKEVKVVANKTQHTLASCRHEITNLKRELLLQQKKVAHLAAQRHIAPGRSPSGKQDAAEEPIQEVRFSARSVRAQRRRLRLSAADYARLVGVSGLTIYNWEHGRTRPRQAELASLIALRGIRRREALGKLLHLKTEPATSTAKRTRKKPR